MPGMMAAIGRRLQFLLSMWVTIPALVLGTTAAGAAVTWMVAERTQPKLCLLVRKTDGQCGYWMIPHRDGTVTVHLDLPGQPRHHDRMPEECIRATASQSPQCPAWISGVSAI